MQVNTRSTLTILTMTTNPASKGNRLLAWVKRWNLVLALSVPGSLNFLILVAVIAQVVIYNAQRKIMNQQHDVMDRQRVLMDQQTTIMEKGLRLSERAYVGVARVTANIESREIVLFLENIGRLPARKVRVQAQEYRWTPQRSASSTTDFDAGEVQLFPGTHKMRVVIPLLKLRPEEFSAINTKHEILALGGTIRYEDGFGNNDTTYFAFEYQPPEKDGWIASPSIADIIKRYERTVTLPRDPNSIRGYNIPSRKH